MINYSGNNSKRSFSKNSYFFTAETNKTWMAWVRRTSNVALSMQFQSYAMGPISQHTESLKKDEWDRVHVVGSCNRLDIKIREYGKW